MCVFFFFFNPLPGVKAVRPLGVLDRTAQVPPLCVGVCVYPVCGHVVPLGYVDASLLRLLQPLGLLLQRRGVGSL